MHVTGQLFIFPSQSEQHLYLHPSIIISFQGAEHDGQMDTTSYTEMRFWVDILYTNNSYFLY
jgi:hypothetical protein